MRAIRATAVLIRNEQLRLLKGGSVHAETAPVVIFWTEGQKSYRIS